MKNFWIVLKYTFLENIKKKTFIISTVILFFLTILLFNIPNIAKNFDETETTKGDSTEKQPIVVIDEKGTYDDYLNNYQIPDTNYFFTVDNETTLDKLKDKLNDNKISSIIIINNDKSLLSFNYLVNSNGSLDAETVKQIIKNVRTEIVLSKYNVSQNDKLSINTDVTYKVETVGEEASLSLYFISIFGSLLLYLAIYFYGYSVSTSVSSEKTSRVMETLITSTKPSSIVLGKTVAMGLLGLCQLLLLIITALVSYKLCVSGDFVIMGETVISQVLRLI
jgi:ABC-2 type transport system permease protein